MHRAVALVFFVACGGNRAEPTSARASTNESAPAPTTSAARNVPTCAHPDDKTCVEAETAVLNADMCFGEFSKDGCSRVSLMGTCTRYGQGLFESKVMLRTYYYAGTPYGSDAAELQRTCENTNDGKRGKGVWTIGPR